MRFAWTRRRIFLVCDHFGVRVCLKYLKSGGARSFLVGIKNPSPLRKYVSVPMTT
jgi:hypothetical protein